MNPGNSNLVWGTRHNTVVFLKRILRFRCHFPDYEMDWEGNGVGRMGWNRKMYFVNEINTSINKGHHGCTHKRHLPILATINHHTLQMVLF